MPSALPTLSPDLQAQRLADALRHSPESRLRTNHTEKVWTYRAYTGGEPASKIDWRQSAKGREIYVREHEEILHRRIMMWTACPRSAPIDLLLRALTYVLVDKERQVGWIMPGMPLTATQSQVAAFFDRGTNLPLPEPSELSHQMVLLAAPFDQLGASLHPFIQSAMHGGNSGLLIHYAAIPDQPTAPVPEQLASLAHRCQWPIVVVQSGDPPSKTLPLLLEKIVLATR